jgi:hemolysin activation/secretion protein
MCVGLLLFAALATNGMAPAYGQTLIITADRIAEQFKAPPEPRSTFDEEDYDVDGPCALPSDCPWEDPLLEAPYFLSAEAEQIKFVLSNVIVEGAPVYTREDLRSAYEPLLGQEMSLGDVYGIAGIISQKYARDGYIQSRAIVPAQTVSDGSVHR